MSKSLENKVAVVTGGGSGIGLATAQSLIDDGAKVVIVGRAQATLDRAAAALGSKAVGIVGDVTRSQDLDRVFRSIRARHGKIDVLFVNAGIAEFLPVEEADPAHFDRLFETNVKGAYFTIKHALEHLNDNASIVLNTSVVNAVGLPGASVYSATKAALRSFARSLAVELAPRGIRVNAVAPGLTETPLIGKLGLEKEAVEAFGQQVVQQTPAGRVAQPKEIANVAAFLASPQSSYVNGAEFAVDGGFAQV